MEARYNFNQSPQFLNRVVWVKFEVLPEEVGPCVMALEPVAGVLREREFPVKVLKQLTDQLDRRGEGARRQARREVPSMMALCVLDTSVLKKSLHPLIPRDRGNVVHRDGQSGGVPNVRCRGP